MPGARITPAALVALARRRAAIELVAVDSSVLVCAGTAPSRNYPANRYAFRASSHFLHLVGESLESACLVVSSEGSTLFVDEPDADDALWHGPSSSLDDLASRLGLPVRPMRELTDSLQGANAVALGSHDASIAARTASLGVPIAEGEERDRLVDAIIASRLHHDGFALTELRHAAEVTTRAHLAGMAATRPGISASIPRAVMEAVMTAWGCVPAYGSIVTAHGEILHRGPSTETLAHGDLLLCDVGAEVASGYASDVTRTLPVNGRFESAARDVYEVVLAAQRESIAAVRVGVRYRDVHLVAMKVIAAGLASIGVLRGDIDERVADGSVALFFPHGVGHLLGLDVHDMEDLGDRAGYARGRSRSTAPGVRYLRLDRDLEPGMGFTIEPGIYFVPAILDAPEARRNFADRVDFAVVDRIRTIRGVRIEDDVVLHADRTEVLTRGIPKDVPTLEAIVGAGVDWQTVFEADPDSTGDVPGLVSGPDGIP